LRYFGAEAFDEIYDILETAPGEQWADRFRASPDSPVPPPLGGDGRVAVSRTGPWLRLRTALRQFRVLSARNADARLHDRTVLGPLIGQAVTMTVLLMALFNSGVWNAGKDPNLALQLILLLSFMSFLVGLLMSIQDIVKELPIILRERMVGLGVVPYMLSRTTFLVPAVTLSVSFTVGTLWLTNRLPARGASFYVPLLVTLVLSGTSGIAAGLMVSSFAATTRQATDLLAPLIMPQVLFSGALFPVATMGIAGRTLSYITNVRWSFEANGKVADLVGLFKGKQDDIIFKTLLDRYGTTFSGSLHGHWVVLGLFVVVPLSIASFRLSLKRQK
jgi:hypothetical protein